MGPPRGFLIPEWYRPMDISELDFHIACIIWGFSLGVAMFTMNKAINQTAKSWKMGKVFNTYIIMVWSEWTVSLIISILSWSYLNPDTYILPSFWFFFGILVLWAIQVQCIIQILINRLRLLMEDQQRAYILHWIAFILIALINISVFIIWIPARLQISPRWEMINEYWDRIEKALFGIIDITLNMYFVFLVRTKLIDNGLIKYESLFRYNVFMAFLSVSMDILLIGVMSLQNSAVYLQFHPLVYLLKLHIELNIAAMITRIVKSANEMNEYGEQSTLQRGNGTGVSDRRSSTWTRDHCRSSTLVSSKRRMDSIDLALGIDGLDEEEPHRGFDRRNSDTKYVVSDTTLQDTFAHSPSVEGGDLRDHRRGSRGSVGSIYSPNPTTHPHLFDRRRSTSVDLRDLIEEEDENSDSGSGGGGSGSSRSSNAKNADTSSSSSCSFVPLVPTVSAASAPPTAATAAPVAAVAPAAPTARAVPAVPVAPVIPPLPPMTPSSRQELDHQIAATWLSDASNKRVTTGPQTQFTIDWDNELQIEAIRRARASLAVKPNSEWPRSG